MTVPSTSNRFQYDANGATTNFAFNSKVFDATHLQVIVTDTNVTPNTETTKVLNTDYTVSIQDDYSAATVTFLAAPVSGNRITLLRVVPLTQSIDYTEGDDFPAEAHERGLDLLTMACQQISEELDRAITVSPGTTAGSVQFPTPTARRALMWNADGSALTNSTYDPDEQVANAAAQATAAASSASSASTQATTATTQAGLAAADRALAQTARDEAVAAAGSVGSGPTLYVSQNFF